MKYEGSKADKAKDKREAKKRGLPVEKYEGSAADKKADKAGQKKMDRKCK